MTKEFIIYDTEHWSDEGVMQRRWSGLTDFPPILIQIGAYKVKADDKLTITDEFICYCKPTINGNTALPITKYFTDLTNITTETVNKKGLCIKDALDKFKDFVGESNAYSYGRDDYATFLVSCYENNIDVPFNAKQFNDVRRALHKGGLKEEIINANTSGTLHQHFKVNLGEHHVHDARNDALSILVSLREMIKDDNFKLQAEDLI